MGAAATERPAEEPGETRKRAAQALVRSHDAVFRRTARRYSICTDDAEDAYQRALEILLTKAPPIERDALVRWMQTVTKREALAVRRQRERLLNGAPPSVEREDRDPLASIASDAPEPTDSASSRERVARSSEALRALKPQEVRALILKAEGYSYAEIGEITGWTYTKINRCMAEGRKRFLEAYADIEEGRRCEDLAAALSAVADGETEVRQADDVQVHLRACAGCRAKLRAFRAIPDKVFELMPAGPALDQTTGGGLHEWVSERVAGAVERAREAGYSLLSRGAGEGATHVAGSGGTRGAGTAALGKVLAVCGATAAGSATCVATGLVDPGAVGPGSEQQKAAVERPRLDEGPLDQEHVTPDRSEPLPTTQPTSEAPAPPPPTPTQRADRQFGFESAAVAPAPSGGEFGGPAGQGGGSGSSEGGGGEFGLE